ncbi:MAG: DUF2339 domain-containing protein [Phycisphaerales bacterium]
MSESDDTKDRRISDLSARVARLEELILRRDIPSIAARAAQHAAPPRGPPGPDVQAAPGPTAAPLEIPGRAPIPPPSIDAAWEAERRIGGHWYAAIGAVVVVVGVALFFELARRNHWFDLIPDAIKCLAGAGFGAALIIAGELLRPRTRAGPQLLTFVPAALCAAGLGSMYASAYAAYGVFGLLGPAAGFALLAANAALGIVLGTRSREAAVTVLSLLGGYATPLLVSAPNPHPLVLPTYLTALLTAGLVVSGLAGGGFVAVRAVAWWGTLFLGGAWALGTGVEHHVIALGFVSGVWALVHAELIWTAERGRLSGDVWPFRAFMPRWGPSRGYAVSISTTAWAASAATIVLRQSEAGPDWTACGGGIRRGVPLGAVGRGPAAGPA